MSEELNVKKEIIIKKILKRENERKSESICNCNSIIISSRISYVRMSMKLSFNTKEYKGITDKNSLTTPNEAVRMAAVYYYNIYLIETKEQQSGRLLSIRPSIKSTGGSCRVSVSCVRLSRKRRGTDNS